MFFKNIVKTDSSGAVVLDFLYKRKILRLKPQYDDTFSVILSVAKNLFCETKYKIVQGDRKLNVMLNCLGFCFTKSRCSLHFVVVRLTFCSFVSALSLRTNKTRSFQHLFNRILKQILHPLRGFRMTKIVGLKPNLQYFGINPPE